MRTLFDMPVWAFCTALLLLFYGAMGLGTALGETRPSTPDRPENAAVAVQPPVGAMVPPGAVRNPAVTPPAPLQARPLDLSAVSRVVQPGEVPRPPDPSLYPPVPMPQPIDPANPPGGPITVLPVPIEPPAVPGSVPGAPPRS